MSSLPDFFVAVRMPDWSLDPSQIGWRKHPSLHISFLQTLSHQQLYSWISTKQDCWCSSGCFNVRRSHLLTFLNLLWLLYLSVHRASLTVSSFQHHQWYPLPTPWAPWADHFPPEVLQRPQHPPHRDPLEVGRSEKLGEIQKFVELQGSYWAHTGLIETPSLLRHCSKWQ